MSKQKANIGLVTWPILEAGVAPLQSLIHVLYSLSNELHVITGGAACHVSLTAKPGVHLYLIEQESTANAFLRVINNIFTQLKVSRRMCKIAGHVDFWIFFFGGSVLLLPMLTAKLLRRSVVLALTGSNPDDMRAQIGSLISDVVGFLTKINCTLSDRIIIYSESLIKKWGLEKYEYKVAVANEHFLDFAKFKLLRPLSERGSLIGYIGRLSQEKGILNFIEAIPNLVEREDSVEILIGGEGQLGTKVIQYLDEKKLKNKVKFVGWISHDDLPDYLNQLKLLVIPSYTEAGPYIAFEAMACGTPVLATLVGSIPDVVKDGETGFIMEDNSPECIARNVLRALNHPKLGKIADNARTLMEKEFTYEAAAQGYSSVLQGLR